MGYMSEIYHDLTLFSMGGMPRHLNFLISWGNIQMDIYSKAVLLLKCLKHSRNCSSGKHHGNASN